jgi:hypothetical protein
VRVKAKYAYQHGRLKSVTDWTAGSAGTVYWVANDQNPRGQITQEILGNNVVTNRQFDAVTGFMASVQSGIGGGAGLQNESYLYDLVGNVTQRQESNLGLTENFYYDNLYRLDYSHLNNSQNLDLTYDATGNIVKRSDVNGDAAWTYDSAQKHAVRSVAAGGGYSAASYDYDANGNMTNRNGATIGWSSYNYPTLISNGSETAAFSYGPDRQYYKQVYTWSSGSETTYYLGGLVERVEGSTGTDWRHYIKAMGGTVAVRGRE